jgi:hypothetical protein
VTEHFSLWLIKYDSASSEGTAKADGLMPDPYFTSIPSTDLKLKKEQILFHFHAFRSMSLASI